MLTCAFALTNAFLPRVAKFGVPSISALFEPSAATTTTTAFARLENATFGTSWTERRRSFYCVDRNMPRYKKTINIVTTIYYQYAPFVLTCAFALTNAFLPRVVKFGVPSSSALFEPSAATTTTTAFARLEHATFGASCAGHCIGNRRSDRFCYRVSSMACQ